MLNMNIMSEEILGDGNSAVNREGNVVSIHDIEGIDVIDDDVAREHDEEIIDKIISGIEIHLPYGANAVSRLGQNAVNQAQNIPTVEESIRSHPSAQNESDTKIGELTQGLIQEYRLLALGLKEHKHSPRVPKKDLMIAVMRRWDEMSNKDRRAIAVEVGLAPDAFEKKSDLTPRQSTNDRPRFDDYAKAAANDRND